MSIPLLWWAHSGLSTLVFGGGYGPIQVYRRCCLGGPIHDYRRRYSAVAMGPFMNVDTSALVGPFRIIDAGIRRDYGPIQVCRHCCFGGTIHDYRRRYLAVAMVPFMNVDTSALAGPLRIIEAGIRRGYGPIQVCRHCCFGGPVQDYRHCYSVATVGPFMNVDTSALVGPFRIIDAGIRRCLWAHSGISTLLPRWAHSGLSTPVFGVGYGPIQVYRRCCLGGPIHDYRLHHSAAAVGPFENIDLCFGGPTQDYRSQYSVLAVGPFKNIGGILLHQRSAYSTMLPAYIHGPIRIYRRHRFALEVGRFETIGDTSVLVLNLFGPIRHFRHTNSTSLKAFQEGPTRDHRHKQNMGPSMLCNNIYMMGPYGLRRKYRHICPWILPTTSDNICYMGSYKLTKNSDAQGPASGRP